MALTRYLWRAFVLTAILTGFPSVLRAESVADFYRGKRLQLTVGFAPGATFDVYARTVMRRLVNHIPGNPTWIVVNMPGAGSRTAANWLYSIAPHDGTFVGTLGKDLALDQAMKADGVRYDAGQFHFIGNPMIEYGVTALTARTGITSVEDIKARGGVVCGGSGAASPSVIYPNILNAIAGTHIRTIPGYPSVSEEYLAMQRGETNCLAGNPWSATKVTVPTMIEKHELNIVLQWGKEQTPDLVAYVGHPVPTVWDYATNELDGKVLDFLMSGAEIGRPLLTPPNVPQDRLEALRAAFEATMKDPDFLADAREAQLDLSPVPGEKMDTIVRGLLTASPEVIQRAKELLRSDNE